MDKDITWNGKWGIQPTQSDGKVTFRNAAHVNTIMQLVGTCSLCGGRVFVPYISSGVAKPVPKCNTCGALEKRGAHGRIVPMQIQEQSK